MTARLAAAFPAHGWSESVTTFWSSKLVDSGRSVGECQRAIERVIEEDRFLTWAALEEKLPVREPYDYGNQSPRQLPPGLTDDEWLASMAAKDEAFARYRRHLQAHPPNRGSVGETLLRGMLDVEAGTVPKPKGDDDDDGE